MSIIRVTLIARPCRCSGGSSRSTCTPDGDAACGEGAAGPEKQNRLLISGVFAGLAALSSWQIIPALLAVFVAHALICMGQRTWYRRIAETLRGSVLLAAGMLLPILTLEFANYPLFLLFRSVDLVYPHATFVESVIDRFAYHTTRGWHPTGVVVFRNFIGLCEVADALDTRWLLSPA